MFHCITIINFLIYEDTYDGRFLVTLICTLVNIWRALQHVKAISIGQNKTCIKCWQIPAPSHRCGIRVKYTVCCSKIQKLKIHIWRYAKKSFTLNCIGKRRHKDRNKCLFTTQKSRWPENVKLCTKTCYCNR
jgi:hypothetical protein